VATRKFILPFIVQRVPPCDNRRAMSLPRTPRRGERVRVDYHEGQFIVVRVDKVDSFATLELWDDPSRVLGDIPFEAIHRIRRDLGEAA
jgi:hypothetical protein